MPNIKSAKKRVKVIRAKTLQNKMYNSGLKTAVKKAEVAMDTAAGDRDELVFAAMKKLDQACAKGLLHKNTAARKKSSLARKLNKANA